MKKWAMLDEHGNLARDAYGALRLFDSIDELSSLRLMDDNTPIAEVTLTIEPCTRGERLAKR